MYNYLVQLCTKISTLYIPIQTWAIGCYNYTDTKNVYSCMQAFLCKKWTLYIREVPLLQQHMHVYLCVYIYSVHGNISEWFNFLLFSLPRSCHTKFRPTKNWTPWARSMHLWQCKKMVSISLYIYIYSGETLCGQDSPKLILSSKPIQYSLNWTHGSHEKARMIVQLGRGSEIQNHFTAGEVHFWQHKKMARRFIFAHASPNFA